MSGDLALCRLIIVAGVAEFQLAGAGLQCHRPDRFTVSGYGRNRDLLRELLLDPRGRPRVRPAPALASRLKSRLNLGPLSGDYKSPAGTWVKRPSGEPDFSSVLQAKERLRWLFLIICWKSKVPT
jgi:hypothetical protein